MRLLAIDTAANLCAAAVLDTAPGGGSFRAVRDIGKGHVEHLFEVIGQSLSMAGCGYGDLGRIIVATGPGSFTGLRVGISAARGLALTLGIPAIGVSTLDAIAAEAAALYPGRAVLAAIDARRDEAYWSIHDASGSRSAGPGVITIADLAGRIAAEPPVLAGNAARIVAEAAGIANPEFGPETATADILTYAGLGAAALPSGKPRPLYLRQPDARPQTGFAIARAEDR
jgi:tRNA threonylcarbamoyl adenosine modification protein YeaZ